MTPRFKVGLAVLWALGLATVALWAVLGDWGKPPRKAKAPRDTATRTADGGTGEPTLDSGYESGGEEIGEIPVESAEPAGSGFVQPGLRKPFGDDLSDPRLVKKLLSDHLAASPVDWDAVTELLRVLKEPLDADAKERLLEELRTGHRHGVLMSLRVLQDGSFSTDLFRMLDDTTLTEPARQAALLALEQMQGGDDDDIVRNLEARMTGDLRTDTLLLRAIAGRGGREAARAMVEYLQRTKEPQRIQSYVLQKLDLGKDREAAKFVADAITPDQPPEVLRLLLDLAAKPRADELVEPLIALNRDGLPDDVRQSAIASLARIGTAPAVDYLLTLARQPGVYGDTALRAIGELTAAPTEALDRLVELAAKPSDTPRPEETKEKILLALGQTRHVPAIPLMGESLKDPSVRIRISAVRGLGRMGKPSRSYVPELVALYSTGDETMRRNVVIALGNIAGDAARSALRQMHGDTSLSPGLRRSVEVSLSAVEAAAASGPEPEEGEPGLEGAR